MHDVSVFVGSRTPGYGFHGPTKGVVNQPEVPAMDGGDSSDYGGRAYEGGEERRKYGYGGKDEGWVNGNIAK